MATTNDEMVYSPDSIEYRDKVQAMLSKRLRKLATERARSQSRHEITLVDFQNSLEEAIKEVLQELRAGDLASGQKAFD
jgi:hypothetical protein